MRLRRSILGFLCIFAVVCTACAQEQTQVVVTREIEKVVTATPAIQATSTRNAVKIPDGWQQHELLSGSASFAHPPEWNVRSEDNSSVIFTDGQAQPKVLIVLDVSSIGITENANPDTQAEQLKDLFLAGYGDKFNSIDFVDEGTLDAPHQPTYVTGTMKDIVESSFVVTFASDGSDSILVMFMQYGRPSIENTELAFTTRVVRSIEIE